MTARVHKACVLAALAVQLVLGTTRSQHCELANNTQRLATANCTTPNASITLKHTWSGGLDIAVAATFDPAVASVVSLDVVHIRGKTSSTIDVLNRTVSRGVPLNETVHIQRHELNTWLSDACVTLVVEACDGLHTFHACTVRTFHAFYGHPVEDVLIFFYCYFSVFYLLTLYIPISFWQSVLVGIVIFSVVFFLYVNTD